MTLLSPGSPRLTSSARVTSLARPGPAADWRALVAIARRSFTIFRRYPSWIVSMFIWPLIFPAIYILSARALAGPDGSGLAIFEGLAHTDNFLGYIVVGTTVWMWQNIVLWDVGFALRDEQRRGTLETNWMSPTWRFSFLLGSSFSQLIQMSLFLVISALEYSLFLGIRLHGNPGLILLMVLACIPSSYGLGFAFASLVIAAKEAHTFVFLVRGLVMIFCGISYPISIMPGWMQGISSWLPPTYMIHGMRNALLAGADFQALLPDLLPLLGFGVLWLVAGYILFSWMERRARQHGTIGHF